MNSNETNVDRFLKALGDGTGGPREEERIREEFLAFRQKQDARLARRMVQKGIPRQGH
ncbi:MAG: hypothetical protein MRY79_06930 [Alphaproteobacteria bacterium]|nr:hypothetical protein [Alphaproteobacteria bacterium]